MLVLLLACSSPPKTTEDAPAPAVLPEPAEAPEAVEDAEPVGTIGGSIGGAPILDEPVVLGKLAKAAIEAPLKSVRPAVRACWEAVAAQRPKGKVLVKLSVTPDGEVRRARVLSTSLRHAEAEQCMLRAAEKAHFPSFEGTEVALVTTPFVFP